MVPLHSPQAPPQHSLWLFGYISQYTIAGSLWNSWSPFTDLSLRTPVLVSSKSLLKLLGNLCISYFWQICFTRIVWCEATELCGACGACHLCSGLSRSPQAAVCYGRLSVGIQRRNDSQLFVPERTDLSWACGLCLTWVFRILWLIKLSLSYLLIQFWPHLKKDVKWTEYFLRGFIFSVPSLPLQFSFVPAEREAGEHRVEALACRTVRLALWPEETAFTHHVFSILIYKSFLLPRLQWG